MNINLYSSQKMAAHKTQQRQREHKYKQSENSENTDQVHRAIMRYAQFERSFS